MSGRYDVAIIGAGPAGLACACLAVAAGLRVAVIEKQPAATLAAPAPDGRDIALTHRSRQILERLGAWDRIAADEIAPIRRACVRSGPSADLLSLGSGSPAGQPLGFLVANQVIRATLHAMAREQAGIEILAGTEVVDIDLGEARARLGLATGGSIEAALAVAADSRFSGLRRMAGIGADMRDFGRVCIVCRMRHEQAHDGTAYEWFDDDQTLAVLPLGDRLSSIVVTVAASAAPELLRRSPEAFAADVARRFRGRWGAMQLAGERHAYPLVAVFAHRFRARRFALIGDAAVGMHPVTAHGYNFGLRGADTLVREIATSWRAGGDAGAELALVRYASEHRRATYPLYLATNALVDLYTDNGALARLARGALLRIGDALPPVKRFMLSKLTEIDGPRAPA